MLVNKIMKIKDFANPAKIWLKTKEGKGTTLEKYLEKQNKSVIQQSLNQELNQKNNGWTTFYGLSEDIKIGNKLVTVASGEIKVLEACTVRVTATVGWRTFGQVSTGTRIVLNDSDSLSTYQAVYNSDGQYTVNLTKVLKVNANDVIKLQVFQQNVQNRYYPDRTNFIVETV